MRVLVTGAAGFVGGHLLRSLVEAGHEAIGAGRLAEHDVDLRVPEHTAELVAAWRPDALVHLAGLASADVFARDPLAGNTDVVRPAINVLEAVAMASPRTKVVLGSCAGVYGRPQRLPISEAHPLQPVDLHGAAQAAVEYMLGAYRTRGVAACVARMFLVAGPGQPARSMLGAWARAEGDVPVGDLELRRDVVDVRDVADGLVRLVEAGVPGEAYNLCGGRPERLAAVFAAVAPKATPRPDPSLVRRTDPPALFGSPAKAEALGWARRHTWAETLAAVR